jgi:hypothetical protein
MDEDVYFDGDPARDSRRRHLERVIKGEPPRKRWPWLVALAAGGGAWALWRVLRRREPDGSRGESSASSSGPRGSGTL